MSLAFGSKAGFCKIGNAVSGKVGNLFPLESERLGEALYSATYSEISLPWKFFRCEVISHSPFYPARHLALTSPRYVFVINYDFESAVDRSTSCGWKYISCVVEVVANMVTETIQLDVFNINPSP
ncbi:hypothetical protein AVEN_267216-1 [Araneus ventricosus]|uniref:Uncharacterized protein n=1 Tax=Araneus ventricosus TaxID=182803 RepID=A0A4Y2L2K2_ARAVE|nr:hypothetical protein AVEN_267216-1 [Araneus ventricosus]